MTQQQKKKQILNIASWTAVSVLIFFIANYDEDAFAEVFPQLEPVPFENNGGLVNTIGYENINGTNNEQWVISIPFEVSGTTCNQPEIGRIVMCIFYAGDIEAIELVEDIIVKDVEISLPPEWDPELNGTVMQEEEEKEPKELTFEERTLLQLYDLEERGIELTSTQMETKLLLEDIPEICDFGTEHGIGIQDESFHELREPSVHTAKNLDYSSNQINRHYATLKEACIGWDNAKIFQLGDEQLNKIKAASKAFEKEELRIKELMAKSFQYSPQLTDRDLVNAEEDAQKAFCDSTLYQDATKSNYLCLNLDESPNRGGYINPLNVEIYQQYLQFQDDGIAIVNPDTTPRQYVSPSDNAKNYLEVYGFIPEELVKPLTAEQVAKIYSDFAEKQIRDNKGEQ